MQSSLAFLSFFFLRSSEEFKEYFGRFGRIVHGEVMFNRETHKSRGFGFIVFETADSAIRACDVREHIIDGKVVCPPSPFHRRQRPANCSFPLFLETLLCGIGGSQAGYSTFEDWANNARAEQQFTVHEQHGFAVDLGAVSYLVGE